MKKSILLFAVLASILGGCIGDDVVQDFVEPTLRLGIAPDTLLEGSTFQLEVMYFNNVGIQEPITPTWTSSDESIISVDASGLATGLASGTSTITVTYEGEDQALTDATIITVGSSTVIQEVSKSGSIATTSSYKLEGSFTIIEDGDNIIVTFADDYAASTALPGLFLYMANNPSTNNGALEVGPVQVFQGEHSYTIDNVGINDFSHLLYYCKPFNVKVGDGRIQ